MNMCKTLKAGPVAPNNLDKMIRRSGLKNNMVAELKGIQPATLSRHKSGDIGISLGDAEEYAKILNCTAQQIFFSSPPIPVLAAVFTWNDCVTKQAEKSAQMLLGSHGGKNPELIMGHRLELPRMAPYRNKAIYIHDYYYEDSMCIYWDLSDDLDHPSAWQHGNLDIVNIDPMQRKIVSKDCLGHYSIVKTKTNNLLYGIVYQSGRNKYTIESKHFGCHVNVELEWGCPIINMILRPELREMQWVDFDVTAHREQMMPQNK
jgi:hypothetical protein